MTDTWTFGTIEFAQHCARRFAWCVKHRIPYTGYPTTAGPSYGCVLCDDELFYRLKPIKPKPLDRL